MAVERDAPQSQDRWRRRIQQATDAQKAMHGTWASNLAFAAGQHWLVWDTKFNRLRNIRDVDPRYRERELFTADRITEYRQAALGELTSDDDRPQLLTAQDGEDAEAVSKELNQLVGYAWEREWNAPKAILQARGFCIDMGVSAIRCRWEPNHGKVVDHVPLGPDGQPVQDQETLAQLEQHGQLPDGSLPQFKTVREGRTVWEAYSALQLFVPPGVVHEDHFPWEVLGRPVHVDEIKDVYGITVSPDTGIVSTAGMIQGQVAKSGQQSAQTLKEHAWLYTAFERPNGSNPDGQTVVLAGNEFKVCDEQPELPYTLCDKPHSGVVYLHWWRLSDRFHSRSLIEAMKDPQRVINRRKTQNVEIFDRGMAKVLVREGDYPAEKVTGAPLEVIELARSAQAPIVMPQNVPAQAMYQDIASLDEDISHASTLSPLRLGENPQAVDTYRALAMLNDNEGGKRATIFGQHRGVFGELVELGISDIQEKWPEEKRVLVDGDEDAVTSVTFKKSRIPAEYRVKPATGQPLPRTQGAQVQKIDAVWNAALAGGAVAADPVEWTNWYRDSLDAGKPLDLPSPGPNSQQQIAHLENMLMRQGTPVQPAYYDQLAHHVPVHREEQDAARARGDQDTAVLVEQHIQAHLQLEQQNIAATQPPQPSQSPPPGPPDAATPPSAPAPQEIPGPAAAATSPIPSS